VEWLLWWSLSRFEKCLAKRLHQFDWDCKKSKLPFPTFFFLFLSSPFLFFPFLLSSLFSFSFSFFSSPFLYFLLSSLFNSCLLVPASAGPGPPVPRDAPAPPHPTGSSALESASRLLSGFWWIEWQND
jgi:hypothetical protein